MNSEVNTKKNVSEKLLDQEGVFKGYTMEELRYRRALLLLKKEFLKEKAIAEVLSVKENIPIVNGKSPLTGTPNGIIGKLLKGLSFADYVMLGFQVVKIGGKLKNLFKKKKK